MGETVPAPHPTPDTLGELLFKKKKKVRGFKKQKALLATSGGN